ncbi:MAG: hypothetical protein IJ468_15460 [Lachnospiraceae bacterium]|nr:hypothetical protein [Lachnospiraceae bacterium]
MKTMNKRRVVKKAASVALFALLMGNVYAGAAEAYTFTIGTISEEYTWGDYYQKLIETTYGFIRQDTSTSSMAGTYYRIYRVAGAEATNGPEFIAYNDTSNHKPAYKSSYVNVINTNMALKARSSSNYTGYTVTGVWNPNG